LPTRQEWRRSAMPARMYPIRRSRRCVERSGAEGREPMYILVEDLVSLGLAVLVGGLIGIEREFRDKAAGFRTLIFICLGATLFTILSGRLAMDSDPTRIAAGVVAGVGFLGAGVIMRDRGRVVGLTTAAAIWLTASLGMAIGGGLYALAGTVVAMVVLWLLPWFEHRIDNIREEREYVVSVAAHPEAIGKLEGIFAESGLRVFTHSEHRAQGQITCTWSGRGSLKAHDRLVEQLLANPDVVELRY
jgi:putative Mg2+ transporter-C (MgtC) family protein